MRKHSWLEMLSVMALFYGTIAVINAIILGKAELCFCRMLCGLPCPGCGLTHSTIALLQGHFVQSLKYCPLTIFVWASIVGAFLTYSKLVSLPRPIYAILFFLGNNKWWIIFIAVSFAMLYIVRLILYFPNGPYPMVYSPNNYLALAYRLFMRGVHCFL